MKEIPREVSYYYLCKQFRCLPGDGGLLSQDPALVEAFVLCMNVEGEYQEFEKKKEEQKAAVAEKRKQMMGQR